MHAAMTMQDLRKGRIPGRSSPRNVGRERPSQLVRRTAVFHMRALRVVGRSDGGCRCGDE